MRTPLLLVGGGGLAREAAEAAAAGDDYEVVGVLDDDPARWGSQVAAVPVLGPSTAASDHPDAHLLLCTGRGSARAAIADLLGEAGVGPDRWATVVHPAAVLPRTSSVGKGSLLLAGVVLTADVVLGEHVVVMPNAVLTHDDVVHDYATVCAAVALAGGVTVGARAYLGAGCLIREHVRIGGGAFVGMGSVVLRDIAPDEVWFGNPARRRTD